MQTNSWTNFKKQRNRFKIPIPKVSNVVVTVISNGVIMDLVHDVMHGIHWPRFAKRIGDYSYTAENLFEMNSAERPCCAQAATRYLKRTMNNWDMLIGISIG
jgi:hypothetical protein